MFHILYLWPYLVTPKNLQVAGGAPEISLGQKYLTAADQFDPNYNTPDQHRDLKKITCPNSNSSFLFLKNHNTLLLTTYIVAESSADVLKENMCNF